MRNKYNFIDFDFKQNFALINPFKLRMYVIR